MDKKLLQLKNFFRNQVLSLLFFFFHYFNELSKTSKTIDPLIFADEKNQFVSDKNINKQTGSKQDSEKALNIKNLLEKLKPCKKRLVICNVLKLLIRVSFLHFSNAIFSESRRQK